MSTSTLPNIRVSSDLTVRLKLKDGGVAVDWTTLTNIRASIFSDAQRAKAGRCDVSVDETDHTVLVCEYSANKPQYLGVNRVIVSCTYEEETKTYDKPAFNFVRWTDDQAGQQITIDDPDVDVEIEVEDISSSILQEAVDDAFAAADRANDAAAAAEHMVDIHQGPPGEDGKSPYIGENGHWYEWDEDAGEYVDTETEAQGETGTTPDITIGTVTTAEPGTPAAATMTGTPEAPVLNLTIPKGVAGDTPAFTVGEVTTGEPGTPVVVTITGTAAAPVLNVTIPQGLQGNTGSSVEYPYELVNNLTTNDATKGLSAAQGKVLKDELTQLEAKVDEFATGKYYGTFTSSSLLPEGTIPGFAYVGTENPFEIYTFDGVSWSDSGATMDGTDIPSLNPFKGLYNSLALLETAYPNPKLGDYAYVKNSGTPATANIYNVVGGEWTDTNIVMDITDMESVFPLSAKLTLLQTLEKVAWIDANGATYLDDLKTALLGNIEVASISAVFNPGTTVILDTMSLDKLKSYLTVTATFSDMTQEVVTGYQLSGSMTAGTNTITVTYMGKTTTFSATVKHNYAGALSTWTLKAASGGTIEYINGYIRGKCGTSSVQSAWGVWGVDAAKTKWGEVDGKKLRLRLLVNSSSTSIGRFGYGIYNSTSPTNIGGANSKNQNTGTLTLADDGYYEWDKVMALSDFTGTYSQTANSAFGVYCYPRALNDYIEIYDVQVFEVE